MFWSVDVLFVDVSDCWCFGVSTFRCVYALESQSLFYWRFEVSMFRSVDVLAAKVVLCRRFHQLTNTNAVCYCLSMVAPLLSPGAVSQVEADYQFWRNCQIWRARCVQKHMTWDVTRFPWFIQSRASRRRTKTSIYTSHKQNWFSLINKHFRHNV